MMKRIKQLWIDLHIRYWQRNYLYHLDLVEHIAPRVNKEPELGPWTTWDLWSAQHQVENARERLDHWLDVQFDLIDPRSEFDIHYME